MAEEQRDGDGRYLRALQEREYVKIKRAQGRDDTSKEVQDFGIRLEQERRYR